MVNNPNLDGIFDIAIKSLDSFGCYKTKPAIADNMIGYIISSEYYKKGTWNDIEDMVYDYLDHRVYNYE